MLSEIDLIRHIRRQASAAAPGLVRGIGDDCAVLTPASGGRLTLITTDTLVEGVHFDLSWQPPDLLGRKAVAVNVSDIAAMGGVARFALLSLAVAPSTDPALVEAVMQGFMAALVEQHVTLIGGDTVRSDQGLMLSVTVLGEVEPDQVLYRAGARAGDQIWVSGQLGQAAAGLAICQGGPVAWRQRYPDLVQAHLDPRPETRLGPALAASGLVSAMIDMSDGLGSDLAHLCEESGLGAKVEAVRLPISDSTRQLATARGLDPVRLAISGGEDYRLLFTAPPTAAAEIRQLADRAVGGQLFVVGEMVAGQNVTLHGHALLRDIGFLGYDHFGVGQ